MSSAAPRVIDEVTSAPAAVRRAQRGAVLGLDRVDRGGEHGGDLRHRAERAGDQVMDVDSVAQHRSADLMRPRAAPGDGVVGRIPVPVRLQGPRPRCAEKPGPRKRFERVEGPAVPVLKDREDVPSRRARGFGQPVGAGDGARDGLLADHVLSGGQGVARHREMQVRRQADVHDLHRRIGQHRRDRFAGCGPRPPRQLSCEPGVPVADVGDDVPVAERAISVQVPGADPAAEDRDPMAHADTPLAMTSPSSPKRCIRARSKAKCSTSPFSTGSCPS